MKQTKRAQLIDLAIDGLLAERKRVKQWYFEQILETLQPNILEELEDNDLSWQESVEPEVACCPDCGEPL